MITNKKIITVTAVLIALILAVVLVMFLPFENEDGAEKISVFEVEKDSITGIDVYLGFENFSFKKAESGWVLLEDEDKKLLGNAVDELAYEFASLTAEQEIENPMEDLAYGFDSPQAMINVITSDDEKMFIIGNKTGLGDMYYFKAMNETRVFALSAEKVNKFTRKLADYRDKTIITMAPDDITEVVVKNGAQKTVFAKKNDAWTITNPLGVKADSKKIEEKVISPVSYLNVLEFVDGNDYTGHGVASQEKVVYVEDKHGNSERIAIGNRRDNGEYYIKTDSSDEIYKVEGSSLEFIELQIFEFTDNQIFDMSVDSLSKASIKSGEKVYDITVSNGVYKVNDIEILKDEFTKVYDNLLSLEAEENYTKYVGAKADVTVDFTLTDGKAGRVEFAPADDAHYAVKVNGNVLYKISKDKVSVVLTAINSLIEK